MTKPKPKKIEPVKAWGYVYEGVLYAVRLDIDQLFAFGVTAENIIPVLITPIQPKRRKRP